MYRGKHRNNQRLHRGKRILLLLSAVTLLVALMCAGTFALLKEQTGPVTNSFSAAPVTYTLTVDANTGSFPETTVTKWEETVYTQSYTFTVTLSEGDLPTKENHTLLGWATDKAATTVEYTDLTNQAITLTADAPQKTLYAIWEEIPAKVFAVYGMEYDYAGNEIGMALNFYNRPMPAVGDTITLTNDDGTMPSESQTVEAIYDGFDTIEFASPLLRSWSMDIAKAVERVSVVDEGIKPISTRCWFTNFTKCTYFDLLKLDTSSVTNMSFMFSSCGVVTELDLSSFDTSNVTNMDQMFAACAALETILVDLDFSISSQTSGNGMFGNCPELVGGASSAFASLSTDKTYARIDGGSTAPGYFTYYKYAVVFEPNYGYEHEYDPNYSNNGEVFKLMLSDNGVYTLPTAEPSHPNGKVFLGWATTADATTAEYAAGAPFNSSGTAPLCDKLYAVWKWGDIEIGDSRAIFDDAYNAGVRKFVITGGEWSNIVGKSDSITVHIKDGTFSMSQFYSFDVLTMTIDGGRFTADSFQTVTGLNGTSLIINGGYFEAGSMDCHNTNGSIQVCGGTFEDAPESGNTHNYASKLADGYKVVENGDGTWTVVPDTNAALVNEEETPICTCEIKCTELTDACEICKTDITSCEGAEIPSSEEPTCSCETKCTEGAINSDCPVCSTDIIKCIGKEQEIQNELESPVITVTPNITGLDAEKKWEENGDLTITLTPQEGHTLPNAVTVKIDDVEKTAEDGITYIEGKITVPAGLLAQSCTVTVEVSGDSCEAGHNPSEDDGNCTTPVLCSVCQAEVTVAKEHIFDNDCDSTCNNAGCTHTREIAHTPNADDGDSATPVTCTICNAVVVEAIAPNPVSSELPATNATPTPESTPAPSDPAVTSSEPALLPDGNGEEEEEEE